MLIGLHLTVIREVCTKLSSFLFSFGKLFMNEGAPRTDNLGQGRVGR